MSRMAKVGSIDDLMQFRAALVKFIQAASGTLDEALGEIRRMESWLKGEQGAYWKKKEMFLAEKVTLLRQDLSRKQQLDQVGPIRYKKSYVDERQALEQTKRLLDEARDKLQQVKRWSAIVEREGTNFHGMIGDLRDMLEVRLPNARTQLENMVQALEAYAAMATDEDQSAPVMTQEEEAPPVGETAAPDPSTTTSQSGKETP